MRRTYRDELVLGVRSGRVEPPVPDPLPPPPDDEALRAIRYEADAAKAQAAKLAKEVEDLKKQLPTEEQRAKWAEAEAAQAKAEEQRALKAGEFDSLRQQMETRHEKDLQAQRQMTENAAAVAAKTERELNDTLVGLAFRAATEWFGADGKTVLLPEVAQSYFAKNVVVDQVDVNGTSRRRVVVHDNNGVVILDPKTGHPMEFGKAIGEIIEAHPQKNHLLRGSGKVGSGSAGGANGGKDIDLGHLRSADFKDPAVREKVREQLRSPGGLNIAPGYDRMMEERRSKTK